MCLLCSSNTESNDHLFIHCSFSWTLWCRLFHLTNSPWVVPTNLPFLISQWRALPWSRKSKKPCKQTDPLLPCNVLVYLDRKESKTFRECALGYHFSLGLFLFLVASWAKSNSAFSCVSFVSLTCNLGAQLLPQEIPP